MEPGKNGIKIRRSLLGGQNMLTDKASDQMQSYFGKHSRDNTATNFETVKKAIMSSFYHISSTDENPHHGFSKEGIDLMGLLPESTSLKAKEKMK